MRKWYVLLLAVTLCMGAELGMAGDDEADLTPAQQIQMLEGLAPGLVRVEITFKYDQGEEPTWSGGAERCPNCGSFHGWTDGEDLVREHRPFEMGGFLIAPDRVLTRDLEVHPRFVDKIEVHYGDQVVAAEPFAYPQHQPAVILKLAKPLDGTRPLAFDTQRDGPHYAVQYQSTNGDWATTIKPLSPQVTTYATGVQYQAVRSNTLIVDGNGQPVGVTMNGELPMGDTWRGSPMDWPLFSSSEVAGYLERIGAIADQGLIHLTLKFRSPKKEASRSYYYYDDDDGDTATERHVIGVVRDPRTLLVLCELKPSVTARLEQIQVHLPDGTQTTARFANSLREYGCFLAELDSDLPGVVKVFGDDIRTLRNQMLVAAEVTLYGEQFKKRFVQARIPGFQTAYKRCTYPQLPQREDNLYLFTLDGQLIAAPLAVRVPVDMASSWYSRTSTLCTPLARVSGLLSDLAANIDASNVPLTEEEENRVAWLGVELQNLDADLARANNVSDLTQNGETGAIVSYVYPSSPAAEQGVQSGWVMLRLYPADQPKPLEVVADDDYYDSDFPWDRLDDLPEQYYDRIPTPWPSVDNSLAQSITELGFGREFKVEFFHDGQSDMRDFIVVQSPPHYGSAPKFKSEPLGLTVKDLTYEVRRYFQHADDDPGVIVAKIEPGSRASVAGLKPYEIVTHVNGEPVADAAAFEQQASAASGELRLNVKRMAKARIVKIKPAASQSSETATEDGADDAGVDEAADTPENASDE
ncbi:MAG: PDZ domain-containing protein [Anaerolineae bacterium]|nr:PDZ domain-containing protein [Anaerolineae bacterium]